MHPFASLQKQKLSATADQTLRLQRSFKGMVPKKSSIRFS
jgi:hypothetical protein